MNSIIIVVLRQRLPWEMGWRTLEFERSMDGPKGAITAVAKSLIYFSYPSYQDLEIFYPLN